MALRACTYSRRCVAADSYGFGIMDAQGDSTRVWASAPNIQKRRGDKAGSPWAIGGLPVSDKRSKAVRVAAVFAAALAAMLASGSASTHSDRVKIFHFDQDGVLPSADPEIEHFTASPSTTESEVYSVSGGLLQQRGPNIGVPPLPDHVLFCHTLVK